MLSNSVIQFRKNYPGVQVEIIIDDLPHLQERLASGDIDFCIEANHFDPKQFQIEFLARETYYLAVSPQSSFNEGRTNQVLSDVDICQHTEHLYTAKSLSIAKCASFPFLSLGADSSSDHILNRLCEAANYAPNIEYEVHNLEVMFHWITANYGIGILPDTFIRFSNYKEHPNYYKLSDCLSTLGLSEESVVIAYAPKHFFTRASREYLATLKQSIQSGHWLLNSHA